jgi:hypothetical protein
MTSNVHDPSTGLSKVPFDFLPHDMLQDRWILDDVMQYESDIQLASRDIGGLEMLEKYATL